MYILEPPGDNIGQCHLGEKILKGSLRKNKQKNVKEKGGKTSNSNKVKIDVELVKSMQTGAKLKVKNSV